MLEKLRIPTLFGLSILLLGIVAGVYLTRQNQIITSQAAPDTTPRSITVTNIEDQSATISWQTQALVPGFVILNPSKTILDDRDQITPTPRRIHHISLKGLNPETVYKFKVVSGKFTAQEQQFKTAKQEASNGFKPIIGSILINDAPLSEGVVYLQISGALMQSAVVKSLGNFVIPITNLRKDDLSAILNPAIGSDAKLVVFSGEGQQGSATFTIRDDNEPLILKVGQDLDLTNTLGISQDRDKNKDGVINSFDLIQKPANQ